MAIGRGRLIVASQLPTWPNSIMSLKGSDNIAQSSDWKAGRHVFDTFLDVMHFHAPG